MLVAKANVRIISVVLVSIGLLWLLFSSLGSYDLDTAKAKWGELTNGRFGKQGKQGSVAHPPSTYAPPPGGEVTTRAKAAFVVLIRNRELYDFRLAMQELEDRFNRKYNYPWVFLNDEEFTDEFKTMIQQLTKGKCEFGVIPKEHWSIPPWIDEAKAQTAREAMAKENVPYGDSLPYRHMCRFNSGFFYRHPLLDKYDFYWRVEPGVHFYCNIDYDPFLLMQEGNKKYSFTISLYEYEVTIKTLWDTVKEFVEEHKDMIPKNNYLDWISDDHGLTYNRCHFWSNFEIGDLNFFRSPEYQAFFEYLDRKGGFFYERWGDAPVHSIAAALFLEKDQIHYFEDIGYRHEPFMHCPRFPSCACNPNDSFDEHGYSCTKKFWEVTGTGRTDL